MTADWELDHVGMVIRDMDGAVSHFQHMGMELLGPPKAEAFDTPTTPVKFKACFVQNPAIRIRLIQPVAGKNLFSEYLDKCGEGVYYMEFRVDDLQKEKARLVKTGFPVTATAKRADGSDMEILFDTRKIGNVSMALYSEPAAFPIFKPSTGNWKFWHIGFANRDIHEFVEYYQLIGFKLMAPPHQGRPNQTVMNRWMHYGKGSPYGRIPKAGSIGHWMCHLQNKQGTFLLTGGAADAKGQPNEFLDTHGEGVDHIHFLVEDLPKELANMVSSGFPVISTQKRPDGRLQESFYDTREFGNVKMALWGGAPSISAIPETASSKAKSRNVYAFYERVEKGSR